MKTMDDAMEIPMSGRRPDDLSLDELTAYIRHVGAGIRRHMAAPSRRRGGDLDGALAALKFASTRVVSAEIVCGFLDLAQLFYMSGKTIAGLDPAEEAVRLARQLGEPELTRKALTFQGLLKGDSGNLAGAIECYGEALELAIALGNRSAECSVWNNLGIALLYGAQYRDAIACFERAIDIAGTDASMRMHAEPAHANIALACLHLEDFARGLQAAERATAGSEPPRSPSDCFLRALYESYYTRLLLEVGAIQKAQERCEVAKRFAAQSGLERIQLIAAMAEGLCEVHDGKINAGLSRLDQVLEKARATSGAVRDTLIAMFKAQQIAGFPDMALVYLHELMRHTKNVQNENALAHHRLHLEQLAKRKTAHRVADANVLLAQQEQFLRGELTKQVAEQELMRSRLEMLERLAVTAELADDATGEHAYRVGRLTSLLAREFGCDEQTCFMIDLAARLHDIGKIGIPDGILLKPDPLIEVERQIVKAHCDVGADLLAKSEVPHLKMAEEIARFHHECFDGSGYPSGVGGTAIPLSARITALADVFDVLTHDRPYKPAWSVDEALNEIARLRGKQFDPTLTELFLALVPRLQRQCESLDAYLGEAARHSPFLKARDCIARTLGRYREDQQRQELSRSEAKDWR